LKGYEWLNFDRIFTEYVNDFYRRKMLAEKDNDKCSYELNKLFLNSLSGKFGQKQNRESIKYMSNADRKQFFIDNPDGEIKNFHGKYVIVDRNNFIKNYAVQISAFITSYARLELYKLFEEIGFNNLYYCDTDSVFTSKLLKTSEKLGGLSLVDEIQEAVFLSPKMYAYLDRDYKSKVKSKGFDVKGLSFKDIKDALFENKPIKEKRTIPTSIKMANHRGYDILSCYDLEKEYIHRTNSVKRELIENEFKTKPLEINR